MTVIIGSMIADADKISAYGSFQDSLRAPIHRWFTYPAGYSHKLVDAKIQEHRLDERHWIADPFVGTGTTSVTAKTAGVNSLGIEAHPFVHWVAQTKLHFEHDVETLSLDAASIRQSATAIHAGGVQCDDVWPALVYKCFDAENLRRLYALRTVILQFDTTQERRDFFKLALTATLRDVTSAGAGWPYIAPSKFAERTVQRDAFVEFEKRCSLMVNDVVATRIWEPRASEHQLINGDARCLSEYNEPGSIDMILTSPPYLNNYDYADRTRLETYFWGLYDSWGDITRQVRDRLIIAATTQIRRGEMADVSRVRASPKSVRQSTPN